MTLEVERPYRVLLAPDEGPPWWTNVRAIGPKGALVTARQKALDQGEEATPIRAEEVGDEGVKLDNLILTDIGDGWYQFRCSTTTADVRALAAALAVWADLLLPESQASE